MLATVSTLAPKFTAPDNSPQLNKKEAPPDEVQSRLFPVRQNYPNACGAACLLAIAYALDVKNTPALPGSRSNDTEEYSLKLNDRCQADIYMITSGSDDSDETTLQQAGYSMPHNIVIAGKHMGLTMEVYENPSIYSKVLNWIYPTAREALETENITINNSAAELGTNQLEMKAVAVTVAGIPAGLHWVVATPDGAFMDPGTGQLFDNFNQLQSNVGKEQPGDSAFIAFMRNNLLSYEDTGISIVFSNNNVEKSA